MPDTLKDSPELRAQCRQKLIAAADKAKTLNAFLGLDGFVDEIIHAVDKRDSAESFERLPTITSFADRVAAAAGRSTNIELVPHLTKLGGNGPIMANALVSFGIKVTYIGALGYPTIHPVFHEFSKKAEVYSIAEAGHTDALEFDDGKIMLGKLQQLSEVNWKNIQDRYGRDHFEKKFCESDFVGFVNWTMIPYMSDIWESLQKEVCAKFWGEKRWIFFDLADPEKRRSGDILRALELIKGFQKSFRVILGANEKEAHEIAKVLNIKCADSSAASLGLLALQLQESLGIETMVVHPVSYAVAVSQGKVDMVRGPFVGKPKITTGAGDHFNSGFCLGKLLGLTNAEALMCGVTTSGFYVRTAQSPTVQDLASMMDQWPGSESLSL